MNRRSRAGLPRVCVLCDRCDSQLRRRRRSDAIRRAAFTGAVSHYLGCLAATRGRDEKAEQYLTDALARHERLEAPFFVARAMLELAHVIGTREPERAHTLLDQALTLGDTYGMAGIRQQALAGKNLDTP